MHESNLEPIEVPHVRTKYRTIVTKLPVPESIPILESLAESEPRSMRGQHPVIWHRAEGFQVYDHWGNKWIDWSSGVLIANSGHGRREIIDAIKETLDQGLLVSYAFVHEKRAKLCFKLQSLSPDPADYQAALLSTGGEAIEYGIKLAKSYAVAKYDQARKYLVSFNHAFHGRTLGAQLAGGKPQLKKWIVDEGNTFIQVPFPDGYKNENTDFSLFVETIQKLGIPYRGIAGVLVESYQGGGPDFLPTAYALQLEAFCKEYGIVTIFDEVQAGFGRTGKMFGYEHYGVKPDVIVCAKGISSSLPLSAVIARKRLMEIHPPASMTSTHSASPLCVAAALANIKILEDENLVENARRMGEILVSQLNQIKSNYPMVIGCVQGRGLVAGVQVVKFGTKEPDGLTAARISQKCFQKGVLMFAPAGVAGECVKIAPPLVINEEALREGLQVLEESCYEIFG